MKYGNHIAELLELLVCCIQKRMDGIKSELEQILSSDRLTYHETCFWLFAAAEYARIADDAQFISDHRVRIALMQQEILEQWRLSQPSLFHETADLYSSNAGLAFGSLYNSNLFTKDEKITQVVNGMKNYSYENFTCRGKLVSRRDGEEVTADLLWLCVPFGLFTPEDLVLVESVKELDGELNAGEYGLLGWYFAEKADYQRAKVCLGKMDDSDAVAAAMKRMTEAKLRIAGALSDVPVLHRPTGNFNRYVHQNHERAPWYPKQGEEILIYAATWPVRYPGPVVLHYTLGGGTEFLAEGSFQEQDENYRFEIAGQTGGARVRYWFEAGEYHSETYEFCVQKKDRVTAARQMEGEGGSKLLLTSESGMEHVMRVREENGQIYFVTDPEGEEDGHRETGQISVGLEDNGVICLRKGSFELRLEEIYYWMEEERIISVGLVVKSPGQERFYGFGERYNSLDQRGKLVDVYVYNQYKDQGIKTYLPMPYFISSNKYGIYIPTDHYTEFDMCYTDCDRYRIEVQVESLELYCLIGTPKEVIRQFTSLTGKPEMLPEWAFGPWMSSNNWDSEEEVRKQVELTKQYKIPATVLVIEAWSDEATYYIFNDAVYQEQEGEKAFAYEDFHYPEWGRWPDPKGMVGYLHDNGLKCILWQIPIIKYINSLHHLQKDKDEAYAIRKGYVVKEKDGNSYRMPEGWFTDSLLLDYTNQEAVDWWFGRRDYLAEELEVDGFKTDGGEFVFGDDLCFSDGRTGTEMRNEYPNLYIGEYYRYIREKRDGIVFSRAGFTGAAKMPAHWAGDEKSTFDAFQRNLCAGLNAGISGIPFWGWDLAGFSGEIPSAELYMRSAEMAAFCPIMQYHAESKAEFNQDRTPWNIAERRAAPWVLDGYRYYAALRMAMLPYIMEQAGISAETGIPLMRALMVEFPDDGMAAGITDQYMFGDDLLVAPVVVEGAVERRVYLPEGEWKRLDFIGEHQEECLTGGRSYVVKAGILDIPVFIRSGCPWHFVRAGEEWKVYREGECS